MDLNCTANRTECTHEGHRILEEAERHARRKKDMDAGSSQGRINMVFLDGK